MQQYSLKAQIGVTIGFLGMFGFGGAIPFSAMGRIEPHWLFYAALAVLFASLFFSTAARIGEEKEIAAPQKEQTNTQSATHTRSDSP